MKIQTYKCDGCQKKINGPVYQAALETIDEKGNWSNEDFTYSDELANIQFCKACAHKVFIQICQYTAEEAKPEEKKEEQLDQKQTENSPKSDQKPKERKKKKKPIDVDMAYTLRKAGWTIKQIHEEFGICEYTEKDIYNAVYAGKKRAEEKEANKCE